MQHKDHEIEEMFSIGVLGSAPCHVCKKLKLTKNWIIESVFVRRYFELIRLHISLGKALFVGRPAFLTGLPLCIYFKSFTFAQNYTDTHAALNFQADCKIWLLQLLHVEPEAVRYHCISLEEKNIDMKDVSEARMKEENRMDRCLPSHDILICDPRHSATKTSPIQVIRLMRAGTALRWKAEEETPFWLSIEIWSYFSSGCLLVCYCLTLFDIVWLCCPLPPGSYVYAKDFAICGSGGNHLAAPKDNHIAPTLFWQANILHTRISGDEWQSPVRHH